MLSRIVQLFPERRDLIADSLRSSTSFRELCLDHQICFTTLARLERGMPRHPELEAEYRDLLAGLVTEIREWLDRSGWAP